MRYRRSKGIDGPLFLARDTHALSEPATRTALEVLVAGGVDVLVDSADRSAPTPALSHAILTHNRGRHDGLADGIVVTPSHNPPEDGGFKYNPPNGGPADTDVTGWIQEEANRLLEAGVERIERVPFERAISKAGRYDFVARYVDDLSSVLDMDAIRSSGLRIGVDPLGGASVDYWPAIAERYGLDLTVTNDVVDPQFGFMTVDWDGRIRMDPSSPYAMARLVGLRDRFDIAFGNDADADRHGIVTPSNGLLNPNHVLSAAVAYLFGGGRAWDPAVAIGKTLVSSAMIDRVAADLGRSLLEVPVGFKWFVDGLVDGTVGFGGEESAGASFLRRDGTVWTTDKDGIIACLLTAELTARTGRDPGAAYAELTARFGAPAYRRIDARATPAEKAVLGRLAPGRGARRHPRRGADQRDPHDGARERRPDRWPEGRDRIGLVRREAVRDRGRLQGLRGELPRRGPPRPADRRGTAARVGRVGPRRELTGRGRRRQCVAPVRASVPAMPSDASAAAKPSRSSTVT